MPQRKLIAVIHAVNDYEWPVSALGGCVNDAEEWRVFLSEQNEVFDTNISVLYNKDATKNGILSALKNALTEAGPDDVVFFYFSGHGTREESPMAFERVDTDGAMEALVCYDGITHDGDKFNYNLIADKELHYTISTNANEGTHILFVLDSCHSGNITRNAFDIEDDNVKKRQFKPPAEAVSRMSMVAPGRNWSDFTFSDKHSSEDIQQNGWFESIPQRAHIAMSACLNDESAFEVQGHGVFTTNMINVLRRTNGEISYRGLQARVRQFVRNQMNQTPEIYATSDNQEDLLLNFLGKEGAPKPFKANCFHTDMDGWSIDLGSSHGMRQNSGPVIIELENENISVELSRVLSNVSILRVTEDQSAILDTEVAYDATVSNYLNGSTSFYIDEVEGGTLGDDLSSRILNNKLPYQITSSISEAQYVISSNAGSTYIKQNSSSQFPVWCAMNDALMVDRLLKAIGHISKWEYVKSFDNPDVEVNGKYPVDLVIEIEYPDQDPVSIPISGDRIELEYEPGMTMKLCLDNSSANKYFCALLYLSNTFEVEAGLIDGKVKGVQANTFEWALSGRKIPVTLEPHVSELNMPYSLSYLKLIANLEEFRVESMEQEALPAPQKTCVEDDTVQTSKKGLSIEEEVQEIDWFARTVELKVINPNFKED